jgi:hypothetical protein
MPPRAIASQVASTMDSACGEPVRSWWRSSDSSCIDGGNFGAPPNPAWRWSNSSASRATAASSTATSTVDSGSAEDRSVSCATIVRAAFRTSPPRSAQALDTASSSCGKPGIPGRGTGG